MLSDVRKGTIESIAESNLASVFFEGPEGSIALAYFQAKSRYDTANLIASKMKASKRRISCLYLTHAATWLFPVVETTSSGFLLEKSFNVWQPFTAACCKIAAASISFAILLGPLVMGFLKWAGFESVVGCLTSVPWPTSWILSMAVDILWMVGRSFVLQGFSREGTFGWVTFGLQKTFYATYRCVGPKFCPLWALNLLTLVGMVAYPIAELVFVIGIKSVIF